MVVPTRDRPAALRRCLAALGRQEGCGALEVVVVDDGSLDAATVAAVVRAAGATLVRTRPRGPAAARNEGARAASAEIVLLVDDDCLPGRDWAARLSAGIVAGEADVVGGRTLPAAPGDACAAASELIVAFVARRGSFAPSNNLACRRALLLEHPFDERFLTAAGEDREWCARVGRAGASLAHEPAAVVLHAAAPGLRAFWRRHLRYGRGARRYERALGDRRARPYLGLVAAGFREGARPGLLVCVAQLATAIGYAQGR